MNENLIFINYRRSDTSVHSLALRLELETRLRDANVFLDTRTIQAGDDWPSDIQNALRSAKVFLALVGPTWLSPDANGTRRIDDPKDWVRNELRFALKSNQSMIVPILIDGAPSPREDQLPNDLKRLVKIQALPLGVGSWNRDISELLKLLQTKFKFQPKSTTFKFPNPHPMIAKTLPIEWDDLQQQVADFLPQWSLEFSDDPALLNHKRIELTRSFEFRRFEDVMEFMQIVAEHVSKSDHHPRWMNVWRTLVVWLTTWDAGHRVTILDVQLARFIDDSYNKFTKSRGTSH